MMRTPDRRISRWKVLALTLLGSVPAALGTYLALRPPHSVVGFARARVPSASSHFDVRGAGFPRKGPGSIASDTTPLAGEPASHTLTAVAPAWADGTFDVGAHGSPTRALVRLVDAAHSSVEIDAAATVYRNAYPGVSVASVRDPERFELLYVVDDAKRAPDLALEIGLPSKTDTLVPEPGTGGLLIRADDGRPVLRVAPPVAIDAEGVERRGSYELRGGQIRIAMRWEDLHGPVVLDPAFIIPFWSIAAEDKGPGAAIYDPTRISREAHLAMDAARNRAVLVRPVRRQQPEDTVFLFGDVSRGQNEAYQGIAPVARIPGDGGPSAGPLELADWSRGYDTESETWEWSGTAWSLISSAKLPGLIDPALAFDPKHGVTVLYGGGSPGFSCSRVSKFGQLNQFTLINCRNLDSEAVTYEYAQGSWTAKKIAGSPPPRLRAGMVWDAALDRMVLFGGRELQIGLGGKTVDPYGPPSPDNLAVGLLNDTWTYDGTTWDRVATGSPPPPREGAQLVYDAVRHVVVLVGGTTADEVPPETDRLSIWEFDGIDWSERVAPASPALSPSLRTRRGSAAFWNPTRQRVTLFGGTVDRFDSCALSDADIQQQLLASANNPPAHDALSATGCLGGYAHDLWEWDGASLTPVDDAAWGGYVGTEPIFRQLSGTVPWVASGAAAQPDGGVSAGDAGPTPLLPWRYDPSITHFATRSSLERAHLPGGDAGAPPAGGSPAEGAAPAIPPGAVPVSPLFASRVRPEIVFDTSRQVATIFTSDDGAAYETDGAAWIDRTPKASPFSAGVNDFFAATWDSLQQRVVLFDPRTAATWVHADATGWSLLAPGASPPVWGLDPAVRTQDDLRPADKHETNVASTTFAAAALQMPRIVFDRTRARAVMLYQGATWEFDGATWSSHPLPPTWTNCKAASVVAFDGARSRTVAFGCKVPAETWEWDGTVWQGPFASPYQAIVPRDHSFTPFSGDDGMTTWSGTLQLAWSHPNAAFESPSLGGVSMVDGDGTLRTWSGSAWTAGPTMPDGNHCLSDATFKNDPISYAFPIRLDLLLGRDYIPLCTFPPVIEDAAHGRVLALRDGPRGMLEMRTQGVAPAQRQWSPLVLGNVSGFSFGGLGNNALSTDAVHPYPFELLSPEHVYLTTQTDPASRQYPQNVPPPNLPSQAWRVSERTFQSLWWPYVFLDDPLAKRTRVLTHRGLVWELGGEVRQGLGEACQSELDCGTGSCTLEHVCCDHNWCGSSLCSTCKGSTPGTCEWVQAGGPEPLGRCGVGECAGTCPGGVAPQACAFTPLATCGPTPVCEKGVLTPAGHCDPAKPACILASTIADPPCPVVNGQADLSTACRPVTAACGGGLGCADATSCKSTCSSRVDCLSRYQSCNAQGTACAADQASIAAAAQNVAPVVWTPPRLRSPEEIAAILVDAGLDTDDAGAILFTNLSMGGVVLAFDPKIRTPITGMQLCFNYIHTCMVVTSQIDGCVASAARCASDTPWLGDPSGDDCCPEACIVNYFNVRQGSDEIAGLNSILTSGCYPGDENMLDGGVE